ncbi:cellulose synthase/poly-beta-1,6-N-acetylglucosamine synthase-like glycosyltransferase [Weissella soli]|uniref:Cellulose synthase/poly-beta-1,6-N-acetylglucosamine synthase-like glycosyltransferase n=2 Tax=Weissella soli TaxID=155866 RepID=A0A288Q6E9_9LACO|nr:hypothetical protein WSWS_00905 [Weissella soli]RDL12105.1 cellulose synthase/poly-beta-1,6-N-acetylglucosamine synthase-like glycosyltransferase [Weissella soli]
MVKKMNSFLFDVSIFIDIGIVFHILQFLPTIGIKFLISFKTGKRKLTLTFKGRPLFSEEENQKGLTDHSLYIVVLIPAWNEQDTVAKSVTSILTQTRKPDKVLVVPNNTTDLTAVAAMAAGAQVLVMPGKNTKKKAGALNYALDQLSAELDSHKHSAVIVMDADTTVDSDFVERAENKMGRNKYVGGVSSIFVGRNSHNILGTLQQMEFARFRRLVKERIEVYVLSGTASLISWNALKKVKEARIIGKQLPKGDSYYDVDSMTEDNELTLALLALGYTIPHVGIESITDVMEDFKSLYNQRKRWYMGALQNIKMYGLKMPVWMRFIYWFQQIGLYMALAITPIILFAFITYIIRTIMITGTLTSLFTLNTIIALILFYAYIFVQVITVWDQGWMARLLAFFYIPDLVYGIFLLIFYAGALWTFITNKELSWIQT